MSRTTTLIATVAGLALLAPSGRDISAHGGGGSPTALYQWNQILQDTIPGGGGAGAPRFYAITHIAIFDAVNAIEREFEPYFVPLRNPANGSAEAAAAQAAHDVLVALNPAATTAYDTLLQQQLGSNPNGFVRQGAQVGAEVDRAERVAERGADADPSSGRAGLRRRAGGRLRLGRR